MNKKELTLIEQLRYSTYLEAKELLESYGKGCIVRPTGFGKTGILTRFINDIVKDRKDNNIRIIYLYPREVIKNTVLKFYYGESEQIKNNIPNVEFITYTALARTPKEKIRKYDNLELIIADECHSVGANLTSSSLVRFLKTNNSAKFLGATATPIRMDQVDIIEEYFDNHVTSEYTLHDAFNDGIIQKPYYCYCSYKLRDDIKEIRQKTEWEMRTLDKYEKSIALSVMKNNLKEINNKAKLDLVIRDVCDKYAKTTSYMKGIIFCSNFKDLHNNKEEITKWFKKAYPKHKIRKLIVTSENYEYKNNVHILNKYTPQENTIDLIFSCDMLNMGYHIESLTFIGMFRLTHSLNIFIQQFGRALSSGDIKPTIIFDWIDNIHSPALYKVLGKESQLTKMARRRLKDLKDKIRIKGKSPDDLSVLTEKERKEYLRLKLRFEYNSGNNKWWNDTNLIYPEDIIVTAHSASYKEIIAKTVAEPISMRCRQAYANWNEERKIYEQNYKEKITRDYILYDAFPPNHIPLEPFARSKDVSVKMILDVIFSDKDYHNLYTDYLELLDEADYETGEQ